MPTLKVFDQQAAADKVARALIKGAYARGDTVPFSLSRLIDLKTRVKVIRAVYRGS